MKKVNLKTQAAAPAGSDPMMSAPVRHIAISDIDKGDNARRKLQRVEELASSMREVGLLQPIVVRHAGRLKDPWVVVAGHRRLAAAELLGWESIRATVLEGMGAESAPAALAENLARVDLSPLEEAEALAKLLDDSVGTSPAPGGGNHLEGLSIEAAAGKLGIPVKRARRRLALVGLEPKWKQAYTKGEVTLEALELLASVPADTRKRMEFWGHVTRQQVAQALRQGALDIAAAPFDTESCSTCSQRIGLVPDLFDDQDQIGKAGRCGAQKCWDQKAAVAIAEKIEKARKKHGDALVVVGKDYQIDGRAPLEKLADEVGAVSNPNLLPCKKGEKGAVPVVNLVGKDAGKVTWAKSYRSASAPKPAGPKSEKEKAAHKKDLAERKAGQRLAAAALALVNERDVDVSAWIDQVLHQRPGLALALHLHDRCILDIEEWADEKKCAEALYETVLENLESVLTRAADPRWKVKGERVRTLLTILELPFEVIDQSEVNRPEAKPGKGKRKTTEETVEEGLRAEREANETEEEAP